jgi:hypothetical protein
MRRASRSGTGVLLPGPYFTDRADIVRRVPVRQPIACTALAAFLLLAAGFPAEAGSPSGASPGASGKVQLTARVLPRAEARILSQPSPVLVTEEDVQRGFVDSSPGILVEVTSNLPGGILLVFDGIPMEPGMFRAVEIRGLGGQVRIDPAGGWVPVSPGKGRAIFRLECRFLLGKDSVPGRYPFPYFLSARPL